MPPSSAARSCTYTKPDPNGPDIEDITEYNPSFAAGNSDMISTVGDLNRFGSAPLRGRLPAQPLRMMLTPAPGLLPPTPASSATAWEHGGEDCADVACESDGCS